MGKRAKLLKRLWRDEILEAIEAPTRNGRLGSRRIKYDGWEAVTP
jgi:hypothetical protein